MVIKKILLFLITLFYIFEFIITQTEEREKTYSEIINKDYVINFLYSKLKYKKK